MTEREIIEFWKTNKRGFMFAPPEAQEWLKAIPNDVLCLEQYGTWGRVFPSWLDSAIYRLHPDYKPAKVGRWVECPVDLNGMTYMFSHNGLWSLCRSPGMVGFGGVRYEGLPGWRQLEYAVRETKADAPPVKPAAVRFWVEE